jgi:hypothetical protein
MFKRQSLVPDVQLEVESMIYHEVHGTEVPKHHLRVRIGTLVLLRLCRSDIGAETLCKDIVYWSSRVHADARMKTSLVGQ